MSVWLDALTALNRAGEPAVLVTVLRAQGSDPREAGCKMVVGREATFDTIGGGNLEFQCIAEARAQLSGRSWAPVTRDFPLGPALGQCCGGHVTILFEPIRPVGPPVVVFGAGHVGRALVSLLAGLPVRPLWFDTRADAFPADIPTAVTWRVTGDPVREVAALPRDTLVLVMTHDHQIDYDLVAAALRRGDGMRVGLIGSATKRARFAGRLRRAGLDDAARERLICPIGIPGIDGKEPAVIAVSAAAQVMLLLNQEPRRPVAPPVETACRGCARHPEPEGIEA